MKRVSIFAVLIIFFLVGLSYADKKRPIDKIKFPQLNKFTLPDIIRTKLDNGIKLRLIKTAKLPLIDLRIMIKGGDVYDPSSKVGLAGITAQLLRIGGAGELKGDAIDKLLDSNGITISVSSQNDYFNIYLSCLREKLDEAMSVLSKILLKPIFDKAKLEEIKTQLASSISRRNDEPAPINSREFNKLIYGVQSPFAAILEHEHLDNITGGDVAAFYKRFFAPDNMLVGITGPVDMPEVKKAFEKNFGQWTHKASIPPYPEVREPKNDFKVAFAEKSNLNQSYLSIGHLGIKENFDEKAKMMVFNSIFAQSFDSRLNTRVRTKMGLTYGIGGGIITNYLYPGKTFFSTFTKSKSTIKAIKAIFDEIDIIRKEKVTDKELQDAKNYFLNSFVFRFSSPDNILNRELRREFYNLPKGYSEKLIGNIKNVTADDVLKTANKYLQPDKMIVFVLGKEEALDGKLSELGKVKKIDISIKPPALKEKIPEATPEALAKGNQTIMGLFKNTYKGFKSIKSLITESSMTLTMQGRSIPFEIKSTVLYPDKIYVEAKVMGMKIERIINGKKGVTKQMGREMPITEENILKSRINDLYHIYNAKGDFKFQYLKEIEHDKKKYDVIYTFDAKKNWIKFYINKATGLIEITESLSDMPGQSGVARTVKSGFKTVKGIPFAFESETFIKGKTVSKTTMKNVKVNPKVDPSIFALPEKK
jgi:zinc protease